MITKITNVRIADGRGGEPYWGTLCFDKKILASTDKFDRVVDGAGGLLCPGFIDAHGHSDISALARVDAFSKISQGFTSEISGNCGLTPFPLTAKNRGHLAELYANYRYPLNWSSYAEYMAELISKNVSLNLLPLCGHNTLRAAVVGYDRVVLSATQRREMAELLERELRAGALGLSSGLLYTPGCFANRDELIALLKVVAKHNKIYITHLRSEGNELLEALTETIDVVLSSGVKRLHISHFKTANSRNWHKLDSALELLAEAEKQGVTISFDRYPYVESMTQLSVVAPEPFDQLDDSKLGQILQSETEQKRFRELLDRDWTQVILCSTSLAKYQQFAGKTLAEIEQEIGLSAPKIVTELLRDDSCSAMAAFRGMSEANMGRIIGDKRCLCGSDESARPLDYSIGRSHPRGWGAVPRFWHILEEQGLSVGEIVQRLSGDVAKCFNLNDRGIISANLRADLLLLDEKTLSSQATFALPHTPCVGVMQVWVAGRALI